MQHQIPDELCKQTSDNTKQGVFSVDFE